MQTGEAPLDCPTCGSRVPDGAGPLLCPVCAIAEAEEDQPQGQGVLTAAGYTLLEPIGRGGMGVVYRAEQQGLNRAVAVKILVGGCFSSPDSRVRFQREAQAAARLKHSGIARIHEIGEWHGQPFISMEWIDGPSLAARLAESRLAPDAAARILTAVAGAVAHAHQMGVAHRDLKPSNILLAGNLEPVLTDFGLACFLDPETGGGMTLDGIGSPSYLPPERVGSEKSVDPVLEDVYGLGAVLYHCLAGRPPFAADSLQALLAAVGESEPIPPRRLNHSVPADLETICLKCLEKSPSGRYASASEVAEELERFLRGEPIHARPLSAFGHGLRLVRRKPLTTALVLALLLTIVSGTVVSVLGWRTAANNAAEFRLVAEQRRVDLYSANLAAATAAIEAGDRNPARELLNRCRPAAGETDLRGCEWFVMDSLLRGRELLAIHAHHHIVTALAWHPDGESLLSGAHDGSLKSWKRTGDHALVEEREIIGPGNGIVGQIQWLAKDGAFLAAEGDVIRCRKPGDDRPLWSIPGVRFSLADDGTTLAVTTGGRFFFEPTGGITLWQLAPDIKRQPEILRSFRFPARTVAVSPDGRWLAAGLPKHAHHDEERDLQLLDLSLPETAPRVLPTGGSILALAFSPDSSRLVATTQTGSARIHQFEVKTGREFELPSPHTGRVWSALFTHNSESILTTSSDRSICLLPVGTGAPTAFPLAHDNEIWCAALHPTGREVATGDKDGRIKIHPLPLPPVPLAAFPRHPHFRYARPVFSNDGAVLHVCQTSPVWKTRAWNPENASILDAPFDFYPACVCPDGRTVWRDTERRRFYAARPGSPPVEITVPPESWPLTPSMRNHGASADNRHVYQFSESGHAATLDLSNDVVRLIKNFCHDPPTASALCPGGRFLVAATWNDLIIHDFSIGKTTRLSNDPHWAKTIVFSPDGTLMASGGNDGHILIRRVPDFHTVWKLSGHLSEVSGLAFSPDGRTLVSSEIGSGLRFWRLDTRREVLRIALPDVCESLVFSPDGRQLAVTTCPPASPPEAGQVIVIPCAPEDGR